MIDTVLITASGFWNPLAWLAAFAVIMLIVLIIRAGGKKRFKKGTHQTSQFFSGNKPPTGDVSHVNLYWGFSRKLGKYTGWLRRMHTGTVNDYAFCFVLLLIFIFAALMLGGAL